MTALFAASRAAFSSAVIAASGVSGTFSARLMSAAALRFASGDLHPELVVAGVELALDRERDERPVHAGGREVEPVPEVVDEPPVADDLAHEVDVEEALLSDLLLRERLALEEDGELHPHPAADELGEAEDALDRAARPRPSARSVVIWRMWSAPSDVRLGGRLEVVGQLHGADRPEVRRDRVHGGRGRRGTRCSA